MKISSNFRPLTAFETEVLARLLQVDEPLYSRLREQVPHLCATTLDQWGSFVLAPAGSEEATRGKIRGSLPYLGVTKDVDGVPVQFAVFVDHGDQLSAVEITRLDGQPLHSRLAPESISLQLDQPGAVI